MTKWKELEGFLQDLVEDLYSLDAANTVLALETARRAFGLLDAVGRLLAAAHPDYAAVQRHALPVLNRATRALSAAPSLPEAAEPEPSAIARLPEELDEEQVSRDIHRDLVDVALALNILLPTVAGHAGDKADRRACREAGRLVHDLVNCYEGRLHMFGRTPPAL